VVLGTENRSAAQTSILNDHADSAATAFLGWTYGGGVGVAARSLQGIGLHAQSDSTSRPAAVAVSKGQWTGIVGASIGKSTETPIGLPGVGVHGYTEDGVGVRGEATSASGTGGLFAAPVGGNGLVVNGRVRLNRSGSATVAKGKSYVDVTVPGGITDVAIVFATIQAYRAGVSVAGVRKRYPTAGKARIYLNKAVSAATPVAWMVIG
jgi:hypothetical protein